MDQQIQELLYELTSQDRARRAGEGALADARVETARLKQELKEEHARHLETRAQLAECERRRREARNDEDKKALEVTVEMVQARRSLEEERSKHQETKALLEECEYALFWMIDQDAVGKRLVATMEERMKVAEETATKAEQELLARKAEGAREMKESCAARKAVETQEASEEAARREELARLAREAAGLARRAVSDAAERAARLEEEECVAEEAAEAARKVLEESAANAEKGHLAREGAGGRGGPGGRESEGRAGGPERRAGGRDKGKEGNESEDKGVGKGERHGRRVERRPSRRDWWEDQCEAQRAREEQRAQEAQEVLEARTAQEKHRAQEARRAHEEQMAHEAQKAHKEKGQRDAAARATWDAQGAAYEAEWSQEDETDDEPGTALGGLWLTSLSLLCEDDDAEKEGLWRPMAGDRQPQQAGDQQQQPEPEQRGMLGGLGCEVPSEGDGGRNEGMEAPDGRAWTGRRQRERHRREETADEKRGGTPLTTEPGPDAGRVRHRREEAAEEMRG